MDSALRYKDFPECLQKGPSPGNSLRSEALVVSRLFHMGQLTWTFQSLLKTNLSQFA